MADLGLGWSVIIMMVVVIAAGQIYWTAMHKLHCRYLANGRKGSGPREVRWHESCVKLFRPKFAPAIVSFTLRRFENVCVL